MEEVAKGQSMILRMFVSTFVRLVSEVVARIMVRKEECGDEN